jgi:hypothetical protein
MTCLILIYLGLPSLFSKSLKHEKNNENCFLYGNGGCDALMFVGEMPLQTCLAIGFWQTN